MHIYLEYHKNQLNFATLEMNTATLMDGLYNYLSQNGNTQFVDAVLMYLWRRNMIQMLEMDLLDKEDGARK